MLTRHPLITIWLLGLLLVLLAVAIAMEPRTAHTNEPSEGNERIVFMSTRGGGGYAIWSVAPDGTGAVQLTHPVGLEQDYEPRISPDGRKIAFGRYVSGQYDIFVMDADGSDPVNITNNPASDQNPSWSPDGTKVAFTSDRDDFFRDVYVIDANGQGVVRLTDDPAYDGRPAWSPDGEKIAFESQRDHSYTKIFTVPETGGAATKVTPWDWDVMHPAWAPDGSAIAVSGEGPLFMDVNSIYVIPLVAGTRCG